MFYFNKSPKDSYSHYFFADMNLSLLPYLTLIVVSKIRFCFLYITNGQIIEITTYQIH